MFTPPPDIMSNKRDVELVSMTSSSAGLPSYSVAVDVDDDHKTSANHEGCDNAGFTADSQFTETSHAKVTSI